MYCLTDAWLNIELPDADTFAALSCKEEEVFKWTGKSWVLRKRY